MKMGPEGACQMTDRHCHGEESRHGGAGAGTALERLGGRGYKLVNVANALQTEGELGQEAEAVGVSRAWPGWRQEPKWPRSRNSVHGLTVGVFGTLAISGPEWS